MLRGFFGTSNSFPNGLKIPERSENIARDSLSVVDVVVVVLWLDFVAFLLVRAENQSRHIAPFILWLVSDICGYCLQSDVREQWAYGII